MDETTRRRIIAETRASLNVPDECIPQSVAIVMDGNGRWATQRGLPRPFGHQAGAKVVRKIIVESAKLDLKALTLYSFSQQNWARPKEEVEMLMHLYAEYLREERATCMEHNVRLRHIGSRKGLPQMVLDEIDELTKISSTNTGMWLGLAINYGSREEITEAVQSLATQSQAGQLDPSTIDADMIAASLNTHDMPDPDLLIRTSGEMRISNFLLWQLSYAEFYITDTHWPDFSPAGLHEAIIAYAKRHRRYGAIEEADE